MADLQEMRLEGVFTLIRAALKEQKAARYYVDNEDLASPDAKRRLAKHLRDVVWRDLAALVEEKK